MDYKIIEEFFQKIKIENDCWIWVGNLDKKKLPSLRIYVYEIGRMYTTSARRISLLIHGHIFNREDKHKHILTICNNRLCVNPTHLITGEKARFWAKTNDCWLWTGKTTSTSKGAYGAFSFSTNGKRHSCLPSRYSYQLYYGVIPKDMVVCHKCDNPPCVNPEHLFLGTLADNAKDRNKKGRQARGETLWAAKLTEEQVKEIRQLCSNHKTRPKFKELALYYKVTFRTIQSIVLRETWRHI